MSVLAFTDPSVDGPNMKMGNGVGNEFTGTYNLGDGTDTSTEWEEIQWEANSYFNPAVYSTTHVDVNFGTADAYWTQGKSSDTKGDSSYGIYGTAGNYIYQMQAQGGNLNDVLIQNQANVNPGVYTFNHNITFTANEGLTNVSGNTGVFQAGNNFIVSYNHNGVRDDIFLQATLVDSRGAPEPYTTARGSNIFGSIYNVTGVGQSDYFSWQNTNGLVSVSVNLNAAVKLLAEQLYNHTTLGSSVLDMSNWSLLSSYIGVESGSLSSPSSSNATATFDVQNAQVHYDADSTYTYDADSVEKVTTLKNVTQYAVDSSVDTASNSDAIITLNPSTSITSQSITSNGYWDEFTLGSHTAVAYVNQGASFNSNGGSLTLSGPGSFYIDGSYSGLYATVNSVSSINSVLTKYSNIENSGKITVTGDSAYATINGTGSDTIVGSFNSLNLSISSGSVYAEINHYGYNVLNGSIINNGGDVNITNDGSMYSYTYSGDSNILGSSLSNSKLEFYGQNTNLSGSWLYLNGVVEKTSSINVALNSGDLYNNGGSITLVGENNGPLIINGDGEENIFGSWTNVTATLGENQFFNSIVGDKTNMTLNSGSKADIWAKTGNANININGGTSDLTLGSGYTNITMDMSQDATLTLKNFDQSHIQLLMTNTTSISSSYNAKLDETVVSAGKSTIYIDGNQNVSGVSSIGSTNFSTDTGKNTLALLVS